MKGLLIFVVVVGLIAFGANGAYGWYQYQITQPASEQSHLVPFKVTTGEGSTAIGDDLYSKGLIRNREVWAIYVKLNNLGPTFQAGDYSLDRHRSMQEIAQDLQHSHVDQFAFTIPEGYSLTRTAKKWEAEGRGTAQSYIDAANPGNWQSYDFVAQRPKVAGRADNLEGYLLPETYSLNKDSTAKELVKAQLDQFRQVMNAELRAKIQAQGQTVDKIVILASMVDREVQSDPNRAIVCGIYYNRLEIPNSLDVDATVLYALGRTSGPQNLSLADLQVDSPYNTYKRQGLPPGPISNPGKAAINACVTPQQRDQKFIFYFADCKGVTHFAHNNGEFDALKRKYGVVGDGC